MHKRPPDRGGFTLVELLIVAIILAILAAIVIPQFGEASDDVKLSALKASLHTVRSQLELYRLQHKTKYPELSKFSYQMTKKTTVDGVLAPNGMPESWKRGPYLLQLPINPIDDSSALSATQDGSGGWMYNETTGEFKSNDSSVTGPGSETKDL